MRPADELDNLIKNKLKLSASPQLDRRIDRLIGRTDAAQARTSSIWRILVKSRITQLAAVVAISTGIAVSLYQSPAYSLDLSIKAHSSIRWLHIKGVTPVAGEVWDSEAWIECDDTGRPRRYRHHYDQCTIGNTGGPLTTVHDGEGTYIWWNKSKHCLRVSEDVDLFANNYLDVDITQMDPKLLFERWLEKAERGEISLDITEPANKREPIRVTRVVRDRKIVLTINQATNLVDKIETFFYSPGQEDVLEHAFTFLDYNVPIDPSMFDLRAELPEDVVVIDQSDKVIGLEQGDMTDEEVAEALTRQFFEAIADKDYDRAGLLMGGTPGEHLAKGIPNYLTSIEVLSVGKAFRVGNSNAMQTSCDLRVKAMGLEILFEYSLVRSRPISRNPVRWCINGLIGHLKPGADDLYAGEVTLNRDGANLEAVTYRAPKPGEFMKKWLLLDPITIDISQATTFDQERQILDEAFATDDIDPARFAPTVTIGDRTYRWSVMEGQGDKIDLGEVAPTDYGLHQAVYAWAQIDMPQAKSAVLGIGSDDIVRVWLNGELVHENHEPRPVVIDSDKVPVTFKKGKNQLVLKIQNSNLHWGFCCRLLEE